jgi:hypothetical protein
MVAQYVNHLFDLLAEAPSLWFKKHLADRHLADKHLEDRHLAGKQSKLWLI